MGVLAAVLERNGVPVFVRDYMAQPYDERELFSLIRNEGIKAVGVSFMTPQAMWTYSLAKSLREVFPDLVYLCGGAHPTFLPREPLENGFDLAFRRESERSLIEFLPVLLEGDLAPDTFGHIKGLAYLEEGKLATTGPSERVRDLDEVPWPARHLFPFPQSYPPQIPLVRGSCAQFFTSRGCPERCTFCAHPYRDGTFYRSPDNVVDEIEHVRDRFHISHFYINDDNFCHDNERATQIAELMVRRELGLPWVCSFARIEPVSLEMFQAMRRSGCIAITFGVESGDPKVRKDIRKSGTLDDAVKAVTLAQKAGLVAGATMIFGHPTETREQAEKTIRFARKLNADYPTFTINTPYPGSRDHVYFKKRNLLLAGSWDDYWIQDRPIIRTEHLSTEELIALKRRGFARCYSNPRWWLRQLGNLFRVRRPGLALRVIRNIAMEMFSAGIAPKEKNFGSMSATGG